MLSVHLKTWKRSKSLAVTFSDSSAVKSDLDLSLNPIIIPTVWSLLGLFSLWMTIQNCFFLSSRLCIVPFSRRPFRGDEFRPFEAVEKLEGAWEVEGTFFKGVLVRHAQPRRSYITAGLPFNLTTKCASSAVSTALFMRAVKMSDWNTLHLS